MDRSQKIANQVLKSFENSQHLSQNSIIQIILPIFDEKIMANSHGVKRFYKTLTWAKIFPKENDQLEEDFFIQHVQNSFWSQVALQELKIETKNPCRQFTAEQKKIFLESLEDLKKTSLQRYLDWINIFQGALLVDTNIFTTDSSPKLFGMFILSAKFFDLSYDKRLEHLIHELGHQEVFLLNLVDKLSPGHARSSFKYAPFQRKLRDPLGRLHSYFALYRSIELSYLSQKSPFPFCLEDNYEEMLEVNKVSLTQDELTPFAYLLLELWHQRIQTLNSQSSRKTGGFYGHY